MSLRETIIVAGQGVRLTDIKQSSVLFAPAKQLLFSAAQFTTDLWPRLATGITEEEFLNAAAASEQDGEKLLADLLQAGAIEILGAEDGHARITERLHIQIGRLTIGVNFPGPRSLSLLRPMISHCEIPAQQSDEEIVLFEEENNIGLAYCGSEIEWAPWEEAGPLLKVALTELALEYLDGPALHAAVLSREDDALILTGTPGAGKSTLSVALGAQDFTLEGDDIAALMPDGAVQALSFPATLKHGAWPHLLHWHPELEDQPEFVRPDRQIVRYLRLGQTGAPPPRNVRCVLNLYRDDTLKPGIEPLDVEGSLAALLAGGWSEDEKLSTNDFLALAQCVRGAKFYRLTYNDLGSAIPLVKKCWAMATSTSGNTDR